jgi:hypothetical protein
VRDTNAEKLRNERKAVRKIEIKKERKKENISSGSASGAKGGCLRLRHVVVITAVTFVNATVYRIT